jgi:LPS-assembly protein
MLRRLLALLALVWLPLAAAAQDPAALVADRVSIQGQDVLVAEGNVEIFHKGRRLRASRIVYDGATGRLQISGPIVLTDESGTVLVADQADLSADLADGILTGARMVLDRQLQLAATEILRIGGRYTVLGRSVASSCKVCAGDPTPLWEIRARRIIHDEAGQQIYFDNAQLRFGGVPVAWIPRLRMPDPTLTRATGFLMPTLRSNSDLGTGLRVPYFIRLGRSRDLTLTPFLASKDARSLDLRYRQSFANGWVELNGAVSRDDILPGDTRGYLTGEAAFDLPRGFRLNLSGTMVSDRAYLLDYGLGNQDRLEGRIELTRTRRNEYIAARLINVNSIREGDVNSRLPSVIADLTWERRFRPAVIGGVGGLRLQAHGHLRPSDDPLDSDGDGISNGRDTTRLSLRADWRRDMVVGPGLLLAGLAEARGDAYRIAQDAAVSPDPSRFGAAAGIDLRWPLVRRTARGATQVVEPVVQLVWADAGSEAVPNEDSLLAEFDEGNLFAIDRLPGADAVEDGARANIGLTFTHTDPGGMTAQLAFGRVFRNRAADEFSAASGLDGRNSDWLAALRISAPPGLSLTNRLVFDGDFALTKGELRLDLVRDRYALSSSYVWMLADADEGRDTPVSELLLDGRVDLSPAWSARLTTSYDFEADRAVSAGLRMGWRNECLKVDLSLSRRFTSSTTVQPTTDVGLSVELLGFGGSTRPGPARACRG